VVFLSKTNPDQQALHVKRVKHVKSMTVAQSAAAEKA
jgi:hypothetical protein